MHNILCLNKISPLGTDRLGENYTYAAEIENPEGILVRSAAMHDMELPNSLLAIARAGAGVNNIPVEKCAEAGIVVFNTPGANANAVKELVLAALLLTSRKIVPAIEWAQTLKGTADISKQVEKGKSAFAGPEILGKKLGVIGLGAIGVLVANDARTHRRGRFEKSEKRCARLKLLARGARRYRRDVGGACRRHRCRVCDGLPG